MKGSQRCSLVVESNICVATIYVFFEEKSKRGPGALSPGPACYQNIQDHHHRFVTKMRDETEEMLEAKRRLAAMKAIADTHRRQAATALTQRVVRTIARMLDLDYIRALDARGLPY